MLKAELLPNTEEVVYQKLNYLGGLDTRTAKISELESLTFDDLFGENNHSEKSVRGLLNREVAFRVRSTGEVLLFDRNAVWHREGVDHPLLL